MKKFKSIAAFLMALTIVISATACSAKTNSSTNSASSSQTNFKGQTLNVGIWSSSDTETKAINTVKNAFEIQTGATVKFKIYTDYNTQIQADFAAKTAPDTFYVDVSMFKYFDSLGVLQPLDTTEMGASNYYSNMISAFTSSDGKLYAIPKDLSTLALYYNTDLLSSVGMSKSDIPTAWEDFKTFLPKLQAKLDAKYGKGKIVAMTYNQDLARNMHLLQRDNASITDSNGKSALSSDGVIKNLNFILSLVNTGAYKTPKDMGLGWNGEVFGTGKCVLMDEGNWVYGTLKQSYSNIKYGVTNMPSYEGKKSSMFFTVGYGVYKNTQKTALAKAWIKYATGVEGMYSWCEGSGTLPSRKDVADRMDVKSDPVLSVHLNQESYAQAWSLGKYTSIINTAYQNFLPNAILGKTTIKNAMTQADKQANQQIENAQ
jgi:multiple sugar transport system substrate-binding protein